MYYNLQRKSIANRGIYIVHIHSAVSIRKGEQFRKYYGPLLHLHICQSSDTSLYIVMLQLSVRDAHMHAHDFHYDYYMNILL